MNILLVSSFLPYPLDSGGHVRLFNLLKAIRKDHNITLICERRPYQTDKDIAEIEKICKKVVTVERKKQWSLENIFKTAVSSFPFLLVGHTNPEMKAQIVSLLNSSHFDLIHVETFYVFQNLPKTYLPVVLIEHNIEYKVYELFAKTAPFFLKPFLSIDVSKIKFWEEKYWKEAKRVVTVSEEDRKVIKNEKTDVVPNGVDVNKFKFKSRNSKIGEKTVLFIGNFKWLQNQKSVDFIIKDIWPKIKSREKIKLWIVGKHIPKNIKALTKDHRVLFDEDAPSETWKIYQKADILLAPITVGGGTSYKILEAMASGVPVVTTNLGIEGLQAKSGKHALTAETSEKLAKEVDNLLENPLLTEKITQEARIFIEKNYSWDSIGKKLEDVYKSVV